MGSSSRVEELKQVHASTPDASNAQAILQDRQSSAAKRAEQRKAEQERRRREAVSINKNIF